MDIVAMICWVLLGRTPAALYYEYQTLTAVGAARTVGKFIIIYYAARYITARLCYKVYGWLYWKPNDFLVDSGAGAHACVHRAHLHNYRHRWGVDAVGYGGAPIAVHGIGDLHATVTRWNGTTQSLLIKDVLHVPGGSCSLISTELLRIQGIFYSSEMQSLYRKDGDKVVEVAAVPSTGVQPLLRIQKIQTTSMATEATTTQKLLDTRHLMTGLRKEEQEP